MTQTFVQLWNVWISEGEIQTHTHHRDWKLNIEPKHNYIKSSEQLHWFDRIQ